MLSKKIGEMIDIYEDMPSGKAKLDFMKQAMKEADKEKDLIGQFFVRSHIMEESCIHGDCLDMFAVFPELISLYENNEGELDEDFAYDMIWNFKWVIQCSAGFYQIDAATVRKYIEKFKEYLNKYGYSLRTYYYMKIEEEMTTGRRRPDVVNEYYNEMLKYEHDIMSDCETCELGTFAGIMLMNDNIEGAFKFVEEIKKANRSCREQPGGAYLEIADYYFAKKQYEMAASYYELYYKETVKRDFYASGLGSVIAGVSFVNQGRALKLFVQQAADETIYNNPETLFYHYLGGAYLWKNMMNEEKETVILEQAKKYPIESKDGECRLQDLYEYFIKMANEFAKKLDKSNETDCKIKEVETLTQL